MPQPFLDLSEEVPASARPPVLPWILVCLGLACLALLGTPSGIYEETLLALTIVIVGCLLVFPFCAQPALGLTILIPAVLLPNLYVGAQSRASVAFLAMPVLFVAWLLYRKKTGPLASWVKSRALLPLGLLALCSVLALIVGQYPWLPASGAPLLAQLGGLGVFLSSAAAFVIAAHEFRDPRWLRRTVWLLLAVGAVVVAEPLVSFIGYGGFGFFGEKGLGSLFWTWLMAFACAQAFINRRLSMRWRLACMCLIVSSLFLTLGLWSDWASGWLPGCVAMFVIIALRYRRAALVFLFASLIVTLSFPVVTDWIWSADQQYSVKTRVAAAEVLWQVAGANPLTGLGPANYYHYTSLYPVLGWYVPFSSHNNYIDVFLQTGILGSACLMWFWAELGIIAWKLRHRATEGFPKAYVYGALGGLAGTLAAGVLGDWFLPFVYNVGIAGFSSSILAWVFLGGLVALEQSIGLDSKTHGTP